MNNTSKISIAVWTEKSRNLLDNVAKILDDIGIEKNLYQKAFMKAINL